MRLPRAYGSPARLQEPTATVPSGSYRATIVDSAAKRRPTSSATVANTAVGGAPCATSVATRRRAACSSATRRSSARDSAFAIAAATSSVKAGIRSSAARGSGSGPARAAITTPHSRPSTRIGLPLPTRTPARRKAPATDLGGPANGTARTDRPVRRTETAAPSPSTVSRAPTAR